MKTFTPILFLGLFLLFVQIPDEIFAELSRDPDEAEPHEVWSDCGTWCESTCDNPTKPGDSCIAMCKRGYFCGAGYIRETGNRGPCITISECDARTNANKQSP